MRGALAQLGKRLLLRLGGLGEVRPLQVDRFEAVSAALHLGLQLALLSAQLIGALGERLSILLLDGQGGAGAGEVILLAAIACEHVLQLGLRLLDALSRFALGRFVLGDARGGCRHLLLDAAHLGG